jgi:hypothetical protein
MSSAKQGTTALASLALFEPNTPMSWSELLHPVSGFEFVAPALNDDDLVAVRMR